MNTKVESLPNPDRLLGDILRMRPDTVDGVWRAAEYVKKLVDDYRLGTCTILEYKADDQGLPFLSIHSTFGSGARKRGNMNWLGHLDTVEPTAEQLKTDLMRLSEREDGERIAMGRGTGDMWGGNLAYLYALEELRSSGYTSYNIQTLLPSDEEGSSRVLWQAIQDKKVQDAPIGATTEILVDDDEKISPFYHARTGRIGLHSWFYGVAPHAGVISANPKIRDQKAHYKFAKALYEMLDGERGHMFENSYPNDRDGLLPKQSFFDPDKVVGEPKGLSGVPGIYQHWNLFHNDPSLSPEQVKAEFVKYMVDHVELIEGKDFEAILETRGRDGIPPFTDPYLTPSDHALVIEGYKIANEVHTNVEKKGKKLPKKSANGVAEDGLLFHQMGTKIIGWSPRLKDAHETGESLVIGDIKSRQAQWLKQLAQFDGDLNS